MVRKELKRNDVEKTLKTIDSFRNSNNSVRVSHHARIGIVSDNDWCSCPHRTAHQPTDGMEELERTFSSGDLFESGSDFRVERILSHDENDGHAVRRVSTAHRLAKGRTNDSSMRAKGPCFSSPARIPSECM